jgi:hypothetical protein
VDDYGPIAAVIAVALARWSLDWEARRRTWPARGVAVPLEGTYWMASYPSLATRAGRSVASLRRRWRRA